MPDSAGNMVKTGGFLEVKFPFLLYYGCHVHKLSWVFNDAMEAPWVKRLQFQCKEVVHVFKRHHAAVALLYQESEKMMNKPMAVLAPAATRVAYWFVVVERIVLLKDVLVACMRTKTWEREMKKYTKKTLYQDVQKLVVDDPEDGSTSTSKLYWETCQWFLYAFEPLYEAIRLTDSDTLCMSKIHPKVEAASAHLKEIDCKQELIDLTAMEEEAAKQDVDATASDSDHDF